MTGALLRDGQVAGGYQGPFVSWASASILEVADPGRSVGDTYDRFRIIAATMLESPDVAAKVSEFRTLLTKVEGNYVKLQGALTIGI